MEREDERPSQIVAVEAEAAAEESRPAQITASDGEALALHEI
jgi:hypothetical protein